MDLLTPAEAARYPKTDISLPKPEELEVVYPGPLLHWTPIPLHP